MIKKILVPIDMSEHSDRALNYALDLAEKYSAEIKLSVAQPVIATGPVFNSTNVVSRKHGYIRKGD